MNTKTTALGKKMGKVKDFFAGARRVDNAKNVGSAYSMTQRKRSATLPKSQQKGAGY